MGIENNKICLIVSPSHANYIKKGEFHKLSFGLQGILDAISKCSYIKKVDIGIIKRETIFKKKVFINSLKAIISFNLDKISNFVEFLQAKNLGHQLKYKKIFGDKEQSLFKKKLDKEVNLYQTVKGLFSYTTIKEEEIKSQKYKFFLRGSGLLIEKGKLLCEGSDIGILSLHHGDNNNNRGGPVGYWEARLKESSGITVQVLTPELDGGKVIYISRLSTLLNPFSNRKNIYAHTSSTLQVAFNKIFSQENLYLNEDFDYKIYFRKILKKPNSCIRLIRALVRLFYILLKKLFINKIFLNRLLKLRKWNIAITMDNQIRLEKWKHLVDFNNVKDKLNFDWQADPFLVKINKRIFLLTEKFINNQNKGVIFSQEIIKQENHINLLSGKVLIENDEHLSYPFTFERDNKSYIIPENSINGCWLYELILEKEGIFAKRIRKLLDGSAKDTTVFRFNNIDYIFTSELEEVSSNVLHLYFSKDLRTEEIIKHPLSPCLVDHSLGRSAGRIFFDTFRKKIIRPSQINEKEYGGGILFSEIELSPNNFKINYLIKNIKVPNSQTKYFKTHHIERLHGYTILDFQE